MAENALTIPRRYGALTRMDKARLLIFTNGAGKDLVGNEIDEAIEWCEIYGANPLTKDIYFFVFGKVGQSDRRVVPVLSINLYRKNANSSGDYRPDENPARFTYDESLMGPDNPKGIVNCEVSAFKFSHGAWHKVTERLSWDERAPIIEGGTEGFEWVDTGELKADGKKKFRKVLKGEIVKVLDPKKPNWANMPETMLSKCCEAALIRKGWPENTGGAYLKEELDKDGIIELTATEVIASVQQEQRQARVGGSNILIDWMDGKSIVAVPVDQLHGLVMDFLKEHLVPGQEEFSVIMQWRDKNREGLRQFWGLKPAEALNIKAELEKIEAKQK